MAYWQRIGASFVQMMMEPEEPNRETEPSTVSIVGHLHNSFDPDRHRKARTLWIIPNL